MDHCDSYWHFSTSLSYIHHPVGTVKSEGLCIQMPQNYIPGLQVGTVVAGVVQHQLRIQPKLWSHLLTTERFRGCYSCESATSPHAVWIMLPERNSCDECMLLCYVYMSWEKWWKQQLAKQPQGRLSTTEQCMSCHEFFFLFFLFCYQGNNSDYRHLEWRLGCRVVCGRGFKLVHVYLYKQRCSDYYPHSVCFLFWCFNVLVNISYFTIVWKMYMGKWELKSEDLVLQWCIWEKQPDKELQPADTS